MSGEAPGWMARLRATLARTREAFGARVEALLAGPVDESFYTDLEEALIQADVGVSLSAAAIEQLEAWGERAGAPVIRHQVGADPAAVVFDAAQAALARHADVLIVDTAGRLHTKVNLMEELKKVNRVIARALPASPVERLLVLDATTGQNGLAQARHFHNAV